MSYIVSMYIVEIHEMDIISINKTEQKTKEEYQANGTKTYCGGSEKNCFE